MKALIRTLMAVGLLAAPHIASAVPITWGPDVFDPPTVYFGDDGGDCTSASIQAVCESFMYTHDLTAYGFAPGAASVDQLTGGLLELFLRDDEDDRPSEGLKIRLEGLLQPGTHNAEVDFAFGAFSATLLASLQMDGILNVLLTHQNGDFLLDHSTFTAYGTRQDATGTTDVAPVPEPTTLALLAFGVTGLAARRRARRQSNGS